MAASAPYRTAASVPYRTPLRSACHPHMSNPPPAGGPGHLHVAGHRVVGLRAPPLVHPELGLLCPPRRVMYQLPLRGVCPNWVLLMLGAVLSTQIPEGPPIHPRGPYTLQVHAFGLLPARPAQPQRPLQSRHTGEVHLGTACWGPPGTGAAVGRPRCGGSVPAGWCTRFTTGPTGGRDWLPSLPTQGAGEAPAWRAGLQCSSQNLLCTCS